RRLGPYTPLDKYERINTVPLLRDQISLSPSSLRGVFSSVYSDSFANVIPVPGHSVR
ncbi:hypothetical protein K435DRAFT_839899, partial [Dendrothele bispora CBS 962.96]